jgi:hypothetical protein
MKHKLTIHPGDAISDFQKKFSMLYPFLKIEFFKKPHAVGAGSPKKEMHDSHLTFQQLTGNEEVFSLALDDDCRIMDLEKQIEIKTGLFVQVFRKSGAVWLITSATDNWTLSQQNEEGKSLAQHFKEEKENLDDHDIY